MRFPPRPSSSTCWRPSWSGPSLRASRTWQLGNRLRPLHGSWQTHCHRSNCRRQSSRGHNCRGHQPVQASWLPLRQTPRSKRSKRSKHRRLRQVSSLRDHRCRCQICLPALSWPTCQRVPPECQAMVRKAYPANLPAMADGRPGLHGMLRARPMPPPWHHPRQPTRRQYRSRHLCRLSCRCSRLPRQNRRQ